MREESEKKTIGLETIFGWSASLLLLLTTFPAPASGDQIVTNHPSIIFREVLLSKLVAGVRVGETRISPDNTHLAYAVSHGTKWGVARDGVEMGQFDEVRDLLFSPDSTHLAYVRRQGKEVRLVLDGREGNSYADIGKGCIAFSPDSRHLVYIARPADGKWRAVQDDKEGKPFARIARSGFVFSPDGLHLAFPILEKSDSLMVVDNNPEMPGQDIASFKFSADSQHHAYFISRGSSSFIVIDGKPLEFDRVDQTGVLFSPQGSRLMYCAARAKEKFRVFVDGQESKEFDFLGKGLIAFSPNGQRTAFGGKRAADWRLEVDGKESEGYAGGIMTDSLIFSPDSRHVAYAASRSNDWFVVMDGKEGKRYEGIGLHSLVFSPDSKHLAYAAGRAGKGLVVIDGTEKEYAAIGAQGIVFSPDSARTAYVIGTEGSSTNSGAVKRKMTWRVVTDGKEGKEYDFIGPRPFSFTPDSRHLAYIALQGEKSMFVVDEESSKSYDVLLVNPTATNFNPLRLLAARPGQTGEREYLTVDALLR